MVFQTNHVLNRAVVTFDFALGLGMVRRAPRVADTLFRQLAGQITRTGDAGLLAGL